MVDPQVIINALTQLDTEDDSLWTADGLPKMHAVEQLVGDSKITRADVTKAAPTFTRETPRIDDAGATEEGAPETNGDGENEAGGVDIFGDDEDPRGAFVSVVADQQAKVAKLQTRAAELLKEIETEKAKTDALLIERDRKYPPLSFSEMVQQQNKRNFELRLANAEKVKQQRELVKKAGLA